MYNSIHICLYLCVYKSNCFVFVTTALTSTLYACLQPRKFLLHRWTSYQRSISLWDALGHFLIALQEASVHCASQSVCHLLLWLAAACTYEFAVASICLYLLLQVATVADAVCVNTMSRLQLAFHFHRLTYSYVFYRDFNKHRWRSVSLKCCEFYIFVFVFNTN